MNLHQFIEKANFPEFWYIVLALSIFIIAFFVARITKKLLSKYFEKSAGILKIEATNYFFIRHVATFSIFSAALILVFFLVPALRSIGMTLFAGAGIFTAILAMASSQAFSNIVSGLFIVIFKPFRVDDRITIADKTGFVEDITLRHTVIRDFENQRIIIPNSNISVQTIINSSIVDEKIYNLMDIQVNEKIKLSYINQIVEQVVNNSIHTLDSRTNQEKQNAEKLHKINVTDIKQSYITIRIGAWTANAREGYALKCEIREKLLEKIQSDHTDLAIPLQHIRLIK